MACQKLNVDIMSVLVGISLILGVGLAIALFVVIPHLVTEWIIRFLNSPSPIVINLIAGLIRIIIFISYILLVGQIKDIKRLLGITAPNTRLLTVMRSKWDSTSEHTKMSTVHDRCGTTFLFIIMVFSILFFSFDIFSNNWWQRVLIRIAFIPLVAGISYEILKLFAKYDNKFVKIMKYPGLLLQKLTTKEPDDQMVEVALTAFNTVMELEKDPEKKTQSFVTYTTVEKAVKELENYLGDKNEAEIIYMHILDVKTRSKLYDQKRVSSNDRKKAKEYADRRKKGAPLQYILANTCFYGYDFYVDQRVLIPRFDTEHLVNKAIQEAQKIINPKILDLMTGSGAIAIAVRKNIECKMTATDISLDALEVAKQNAEKNGCGDIEFISGSLFEKVQGKFDMILCNPPYIPTGDLKELDSEVKDYEPLIALDGGADGWTLSGDGGQGALIFGAWRYLIMEAGINQAEIISKMFEQKYDIELIHDYNNPPVARVILARLKEDYV